MLARSFWAVWVIVFGISSVAHAQLQEVDARVAAVSPFVHDKTVVVVHLDLRNLDLATAADRIGALAPAEAQEQLGQVKAGAKMVEFARKGMMEAGGSDLYVIVDSTEAGKEPMVYLMIPVETGKEPEEVMTNLSAMPGVDKEPFVHKGCVIYGDDGTKEYLQTVTPASAERFAHAFKYTGKTDLQVVVAPTEAALEVAKANNPLGAVDEQNAEMAKEMKGFVITANLPPKPALALFMLMKDEAAAKKAHELIQEGLNGEQVQQVKAHPLGARAIELFTPALDGDKLRIVLTESNGGIGKLTDILKEAAALAMTALRNGQLPIPGGFGPGGPGGPPFGEPGNDPFGSPGFDIEK